MVELSHQDRQEYTEQIFEALQENNCDGFRELFIELHPTDQAEILAVADKRQRSSMYKFVSPAEFAEVFQVVELKLQIRYLAELHQNYAIDVLNHMSYDNLADFLGKLPESTKDMYLDKMNTADALELKQLLKYPDQTAGAIMTTEYVSISKGEIVDHVMDRLRLEAPDAETIYYLYVIDEKQHLVGVLSLRDLLVARLDQRIEELMSTRIVSVKVEEDQEEVAKIMQKYNFLALPVTAQGRLVGIVTVDDVIDVVREETTEDFHKMATVEKFGENINDAGVLFLFRKRITWLVLLVFINIFSGAGIAFFEDTIAAYIALIFFLPLLVGSGGNAGSQSATLMIRALSTGEIRLRDWARLFGKEISVALLLGATMALAVSGIGIIRGGIDIGVVVSLTMIVVVLVGSLIGMSLPFILSKLRMDPATASGPLITSICDIAGILIYFSIATLYLGI